MKDLNILASSNEVGREFLKTLSSVFWDNFNNVNLKRSVDVYSNFTKIIILEKGDNFKNIDLVALNSKDGVNLVNLEGFIIYLKNRNAYLYKVNYMNQSVDILIEEKNLDIDISEFFQTKLLTQK